MPRSSLPTCSQHSSTSGSTKLWAQTLDLAGHPFRQCGRADAMLDADVVPGVLFCNRDPLRLRFRLPVVYFHNAFCHLYRLEIANVISSVGQFPQSPSSCRLVGGFSSFFFFLLPSSPSGHRFRLAILKD